MIIPSSLASELLVDMASTTHLCPLWLPLRRNVAFDHNVDCLSPLFSIIITTIIIPLFCLSPYHGTYTDNIHYRQSPAGVALATIDPALRRHRDERRVIFQPVCPDYCILEKACVAQRRCLKIAWSHFLVFILSLSIPFPICRRQGRPSGPSAASSPSRTLSSARYLH